MKEKIGVVGLGLGYSLSHYLAYKGYDVVGVDIREEAWKNPRVDVNTKEWMSTKMKLFEDNFGPLKFTTDYNELSDRDIIMLFVSTPLDENTMRLSISNVDSALKSALKVNIKAIYLNLSTLPIGGYDILSQYYNELFYTPPMVKAANFIDTFINPPSEWQLIGYPPPYKNNGNFITGKVVGFYKNITYGKIIITSADIVEKAKLLTNMMLSSRIIFANAIQEVFPDDGREICEIIGQDKRIGSEYLTPGARAAGPCFPRDLMELEEFTREGFIDKKGKRLNDTYYNLFNLIYHMNKANKTEELV